jgi:hypothetical protein
MSLIDNTRAAYRILAIHGFYGPDDHLYEEGEEIYFDGEPNEEMEPLNQVARERIHSYLENLDTLGREAALKAGKAYAGRPRSLDGGLALATAIQRQEMGLMGARKDSVEITRVSEEDVPETGSFNPKRKAGRPKKITSVAA